MVYKLGDRYETLHFCYEVGAHWIWSLPADPRNGERLHGGCAIADPAPACQRVKTNRRDALSLARLLRAGN
jgi:hypothetical protein